MWLTAIVVLNLLLCALPYYFTTLRYWPLVTAALMLYLAWVPRESKMFRSLALWRRWLHEGYFRFKTVPATHPPDGDTPRVIYAVYPHGVYSIGTIVYFALSAAHLHVKCAATSVLFVVPFIKELAGLAGALPANAGDITRTLRGGHSIAMCPGGIRELPGLDPARVAEGGGVVRRDGFIRIALAEGVSIVPVWSQGENDLYSVWIPMPALQRALLRWIYYPWPVVSWGHAWFPFWPRSRPVTLVFGDAIEMRSGDTVESVRERFYTELARIKQSCPF